MAKPSKRECFECAGYAEHNHHVVPKSRGGTNTVPLCHTCHARAHHKHRNMHAAVLSAAALRDKRARLEVYGPTPYGYDRDGERLVENKAEQKTLAYMRAKRAAGWTLDAIAAALNRRKIASKQGGIWHATSVRRILINPIYTTKAGL